MEVNFHLFVEENGHPVGTCRATSMSISKYLWECVVQACSMDFLAGLLARGRRELIL